MALRRKDLDAAFRENWNCLRAEPLCGPPYVLIADRDGRREVFQRFYSFEEARDEAEHERRGRIYSRIIEATSRGWEMEWFEEML